MAELLESLPHVLAPRTARGFALRQPFDVRGEVVNQPARGAPVGPLPQEADARTDVRHLGGRGVPDRRELAADGVEPGAEAALVEENSASRGAYRGTPIDVDIPAFTRGTAWRFRCSPAFARHSRQRLERGFLQNVPADRVAQGRRAAQPRHCRAEFADPRRGERHQAPRIVELGGRPFVAVLPQPVPEFAAVLGPV